MIDLQNIFFYSGFSVLFLIGIVWTIFWKGAALWISAKNGEKKWFIALLIINTMGILEIIYIFFVKKMKFNFKTYKFEKGKSEIMGKEEIAKIVEAEKQEEKSAPTEQNQNN